jgi:dihydrofolate reductase
MIVAMAHRNVIGMGNSMPWHLPADLAHFKKTTLGHTMLMGSATYRSIGRPLPGRNTWVVSSQMKDTAGIQIFRSIEKALEEARRLGLQKLMVVGGGTIYRSLLPLTDELIVTRIDLETEGDTHFPEIDIAAWDMYASEYHKQDSTNPYDYTFEYYKRRK